MYRKYPLTLRFLLLIVFPCLACGVYVYRSLAESVPPQAGVLAVQSLHQAVVIDRDAHGFPVIRAHTDREAFYALGFAHAQDRLWQLELQRRIAKGRLSEIFGKDSVQQDMWFRTLGLERSAHESWQVLSPEARDSLQAYADGVNAWLATRPALPPEFTLLDIRPAPWTVYDSLAWAKVFALNLGGNHRREIERLVALQRLPSERLAALFPEYQRSGAETAVAWARKSGRQLAEYAEFQRTLERELRIGGRYVGSNAWAVSGRLTGGRGALLANDPHLGLQIPSLWYMASLRGDRLDVSGATLVGLPIVVFGRNADIAWGGTNLMADVQDLYIEQTDPEDPSRYADNGAWRPFEIRDEYIEIRQEFPAQLRGKVRPLRLRVRSTRHGPIVSDLFPSIGQPAALRWTALDSDDTTYESFFRVNYARDWAGFQTAVRHHVAPALNLLYADRQGNIGEIAVGRIPVRSAGDGSLPVAGWNDLHRWTGSIPFADMPRSYNPPSGILVSANNKPVDASYPYFISNEWAPPQRADRIAALLRQNLRRNGRLDLADMQRIQGDQHSDLALLLLRQMLRHEPDSHDQQAALALLRKWDGDMGPESRGATLFNEWTRQLRRTLLADDVRGDWSAAAGNRMLQGVAESTDPGTLARLLQDPSGYWCDNRETHGLRETCDEALDVSLGRALRELRKLDGGSPTDLPWGEHHNAVYRHLPFSDVRLMRRLFERRTPSGGSPDTINVATADADPSGGGYVQNFGAGFRQVIALERNGGEHLYANSTGQSGNPLSPHYDDMIESFRNMRYYRVPSDGQRRLQLVPKTPRPVVVGAKR